MPLPRHEEPGNDKLPKFGRNVKMKNLLKVAAVCVVVFAGSSLTLGECRFLNPKLSGYGEISLNGESDTADGGFDVLSDGRIVAQVGQNVNLYAADGAFTRTLTTWSDSGYGSFVRMDPTETTVWFGKTNIGTDDYIRTIPLAASGGTYTPVAMLSSNFDLEFAQVGGEWKPFAAGLNAVWGGGTNDVTGIWRLDTSGNDVHDCIVELGGNSTGLAFDSAGNLLPGVYNSSHVSDQGMAKFLQATWQAKIDTDPTQGDSYITLTDGDMLTYARGGLYDVTVDDVGNILFDTNNYDISLSEVCVIETGKDYSGYGDYKYDVMATGDASVTWWNWLTQMDANGNVLEDGRGYLTDSASGGVVGYVPEPATMCLLAVGGIGVLLRRRRNRG